MPPLSSEERDELEELLATTSFRTAPDGGFDYVNAGWLAFTGGTVQDALGEGWMRAVHPSDLELLRSRYAESVAAQRPLVHELRLRHRDGRYRDVVLRTVPRLGKDGGFDGLAGTFVELGDAHAAGREAIDEGAAAMALRHLTDSMAAILDGIADGVVAVDAQGKVSRVNPVAAKLLGCMAADALGRPLDDVARIVDPETRAPAVRGRHAVSRGALLVRGDGSEVPVTCHAFGMRDLGGGLAGAVIVLRDVTSEKKAEADRQDLQRTLVMTDRLASLGTLAAGVAHEINNPLAYVMMNLDLLLEELQAFDDSGCGGQAREWEAMAVEARAGAERIRKIVHGLKTFARDDGTEERVAVLQLDAVLDVAIDLASNEIRHRGRLVKEYGDTPPVEADEARLGQVFINLLVNAAQALPEGNADAHEVRIVTSTDRSGRAVVEVRDTGPGIPANVLPRVFDPFFSTKPVGQGTGLGLSLCHAIVARLGGEISVENGRDRGAIFRVALPSAAARARARAPAEDAAGPRPRRGSILVVDDEAALGAALARVLRGHAVTTVTSASEALDLLRGGAEFDAILCDIMMPGMSGVELYGQLRAEQPRAAARVVFMTGGAFTPGANAFLDEVPNQRLDKPFDSSRVREVVDALLESPPAAAR